MSDQTSNSYTATFFVIPSCIIHLPGISLGYLKVYETIFQFWNHNKPCFLSEESLCERTGLGRSQVYEALSYFENMNELMRVKKKGKRYFIRPIKDLETNCTENVPTSGRADPDVRWSGLATSGRADHKKKNINKENKCVGEDPSHTENSLLKTKKGLAEKNALEAPEIKELFDNKFSGTNLTLEKLFAQCQEHYEQKSLWATRDRFLKWIQTEKIENHKNKSAPINTKLKTPTEDDFRKHEGNISGYEWVAEYIQSMHALDRLPTQEFYQMGLAGARGYKWVKVWMEIKGLNKKQK